MIVRIWSVALNFGRYNVYALQKDILTVKNEAQFFSNF